MNKSLEALERLRNTLLAEGYWQDILQDVSIIEKELRALETIEENLKYGYVLLVMIKRENLYFNSLIQNYMKKSRRI